MRQFVSLTVEFEASDLPPRELRSLFVEELCDAIGQAQMRGDVDQAVAEELIRALPEPDRI